MMSTLGDVLVIDDEREVIRVLSAYLEDMGLFRNVIIAKDGVEASIKIENQKFELVVVDYKLPKKNGVDIIRGLATSSQNSVDNVIFMSGTFEKKALEQVLKLGVKNFLVKPFDRVTFQTKVNETVGPK